MSDVEAEDYVQPDDDEQDYDPDQQCLHNGTPASEPGSGGEERRGEEHSDEEHGGGLSDLVVQHGAHAFYQVPERFLLQKARKLFAPPPPRVGKRSSATDADWIKKASKSPGEWTGLQMNNIWILGGKNLTSGVEETSPWVTLDVKGGEDTDDNIWLRSVPGKVVTHLQKEWRANIKERRKTSPEKASKMERTYQKVLSWKESDCSGTKVKVAELGIGKGGMRVLKERPRSIVALQAQQRVLTRVNPKLSSAIGKNSSGSGGSSSTLELEEHVPEVAARTIRLGPAGEVHTFNVDGVIYCTIVKCGD